MLDSIYVGRCVSDSEYCSVHSGSFTDVNIWNRALSVDEMIRWTNCRWISLINNLIECIFLSQGRHYDSFQVFTFIRCQLVLCRRILLERVDGKIRESLFFYVKIFEYNSVVRKAWRLCGHFLDQREIVLDSIHR